MMDDENPFHRLSVLEGYYISTVVDTQLWWLILERFHDPISRSQGELFDIPLLIKADLGFSYHYNPLRSRAELLNNSWNYGD